MDQGAEIVFILAEEAGCLELQWHTSKKTIQERPVKNLLWNDIQNVCNWWLGLFCHRL